MVRIKWALVPASLLLTCSALLIPPRSLSQSNHNSESARRVTLFNAAGSKSYDAFKKSTVIFRPTLAYNRVTGPNRQWDLRYGGLNFNGNMDWFILDCQTRRGGHWNRIRDLGEMEWSDQIAVPVLPILPCRSDEQCGRIQISSGKPGKKIDDEDVNPHVAKIVVGHIYAIHISEGERDLGNPREFVQHIDYYALVRVEELKPNESVTITWKKVPAPK